MAEAAGPRSRMTRRHQVDEAASARADTDTADTAEEEGAASSWQQEVDSICAGTHPLLIAGLKKHEQHMQAQLAQAERIRKNQAANIMNLFECDKKQTEDEYQAQLEFFQSRLIDSIEQKQRKAAGQKGFRMRAPSDAKQPEKRKKLGETSFSEAFALKAEESKSDVDDMLRNLDHYSVRNAALASEDMRSSSGEVWFDRSRQSLHCNGHSFERGSPVYVYQHGQRIERHWTITAMNAVEATLHGRFGSKLKVTLSQLRHGRYSFRPASA